MMVKEIAAIVAVATHSQGIGYRGEMPWKLPGDMKHFQTVTMETSSTDKKNAVIMGRKTWESIPQRFRPLKGRTNVILTRDIKNIDNASTTTTTDDDIIVATSLKDVMNQLKTNDEIEKVFIIGGSEIYKEAVNENILSKVYLTKLWNLPKAENGEEQQFDTFFPLDLSKHTDQWEEQLYSSSASSKSTTPNVRALADKENISKPENNNNNNKNNDIKKDITYNIDPKSGICYEFVVYTNKLQQENPKAAVVNLEEMQYLDMCRDILETGVKRGDRTGTGTISKFGTQMRFSLRNDQFPLLTTKRTFWRGVAEELLWFVSGNTNANELAEKNIHIWDGNGSREFLDSRGLNHREEGDLGPVYGFQWRHFGAKYIDMHTDYTGKGVDQLAECIDKIKNNPEDRRIIMSAWNPCDLNDMALPPCHMFCQFYVDTENNELSCQMYQRSADMGLGVPFNIASYALLTRLIAHVTGRKPGDFVHTIGDAHIYSNHVEAIQEQLKRQPKQFPKLIIKNDTTADGKPKTIDDFTFDDFEIIGYNPHKPIKMKMAV